MPEDEEYTYAMVLYRISARTIEQKHQANYQQQLLLLPQEAVKKICWKEDRCTWY